MHVPRPAGRDTTGDAGNMGEMRECASGRCTEGHIPSPHQHADRNPNLPSNFTFRDGFTVHGDRAHRIEDPWRCADAPCCPFFARGEPASASRKPPDHTGSASGGRTRPRRMTVPAAPLRSRTAFRAPASPVVLPESPVDPPGNLSYRVPEHPLDVIALLSDSARQAMSKAYRLPLPAGQRSAIIFTEGSVSQCCAQPCDDTTPAGASMTTLFSRRLGCWTARPESRSSGSR
ncbi:hypothetical protein EV641_106180 [Rhodococcus sp. SMB37]|nr:hypothetical protein EV641_106180 [Rhodococcus sp. SMB37]